MGMKAWPLTDHGNMFGAIELPRRRAARGIKPILGCEVYVAPGSRHDKTGGGIQEAYNHLTLLATDAAGYHNLLKLVSLAYIEGFYYRPRIDKDALAAHSRGLIGLSGCLAGEIATQIRCGPEAEAAAHRGAARRPLRPRALLPGAAGTTGSRTSGA